MPETAAIDRVERVRNKPKAQWVALPDEISPMEAASSAKSRLVDMTHVDSLESLKSEEKEPQSIQKKQQASPGFWANAWSKICSLFGYSAAAATPTGEGSSNKPGGGVGAIQAVGGSPTLEAPYLFDQKKFTQLLKETRDSLHQVQETNETAEEDLSKSEKSSQWLSQYLKAQREIYEEGADLVRVKFIRHQEAQREVRKTLADTKMGRDEFAAKERFWGRWKTGSMVALGVASLGLIALHVIPVAGFTLGAVALAGTVVLKIAGPVASGAHAITTLMKSSMTQQMRDKQSAVTTLTHQSTRFSQFLIPDDMGQMKQDFDLSLKIVTDHLKRHEEKRSQAIKSIVSQMR